MMKKEPTIIEAAFLNPASSIINSSINTLPKLKFKGPSIQTVDRQSPLDLINVIGGNLQVTVSNFQGTIAYQVI